MKRIRKLLPIIVTVAFSAVTLGHESQFIGSFEEDGLKWLGLPFAAGIDVAIFVSMYFTKWAKTKRAAWWSYVIFTLASGSINLAHVLGTAIEQGRFGNGWLADLGIGAGVAVVALFPAAAQSVMGWLAREADGLPAVKGGIGAFIASFFESDATEADEPQRAQKGDAVEIVGPQPEPQQSAAVVLTVADFRTFLASHNGSRATITRDDVFDWADSAGLDVTDRDNRDKVSRWCRAEGIGV